MARKSARQGTKSQTRGSNGFLAKKVAASATGLLQQDHREAIALFDWYESLDDANAKVEIGQRLCIALLAHMQVEEELFYPAAEKATGESALADQAVAEHAKAKELIHRLELERDANIRDAMLRELRDAIEEHVDFEESELFPKAHEAGLDLIGIGAVLGERKLEYLRRLTGKGVPREAAE